MPQQGTPRERPLSEPKQDMVSEEVEKLLLQKAIKKVQEVMRPVLALLRRQGICCVIFLDDLLIMQQTQRVLEKTAHGILTLLQVLGFRINWEKSALVQTLVIQYLVIKVDSIQMTVALPEDKLRATVQACSQASKRKSIAIRDLARLIGRMTATAMAVLQVPLCYRNLQRLKNQAPLTASGNYEAEVLLDQAAKEELQWWKHELLQWKGRPLQPPPPDLTIEMDASLGWGAVADRVGTWGLWSEEERQRHINHLELFGWQCRPTQRTRQCLTYTCGWTTRRRCDTLSRVPPGVTQCDSRQGISDTPIICRMEIEQVSVPGSDEPLRPVQCGSLRIEAELSTSSLHQLAA